MRIFSAVSSIKVLLSEMLPNWVFKIGTDTWMRLPRLRSWTCPPSRPSLLTAVNQALPEKQSVAASFPSTLLNWLISENCQECCVGSTDRHIEVIWFHWLECKWPGRVSVNYSQYKILKGSLTFNKKQLYIKNCYIELTL